MLFDLVIVTLAPGAARPAITASPDGETLTMSKLGGGDDAAGVLMTGGGTAGTAAACAGVGRTAMVGGDAPSPLATPSRSCVFRPNQSAIARIATPAPTRRNGRFTDDRGFVGVSDTITKLERV